MAIDKQPALTGEQIRFILQHRDEGMSWAEVVPYFNECHGSHYADRVIRKAVKKYQLANDLEQTDIDIAMLRQNRTAQRSAMKANRTSRLVLDALETRDTMLAEIRTAVQATAIETNYEIAKPTKPKKKKGRPNMIIELLLSDLHYGKKTDKFDHATAEKRMAELGHVVLSELKRKADHYNISEVVVALLGDILENSLMHKSESLKGCEFSNSQQVVAAIRSIWKHILLPLGMSGHKITVMCVPGNHDRPEQTKTYETPGLEYLTYIIYSVLDDMTRLHKFKNITFNIATGPYLQHQIFTDKVIYEHFDLVKANTRKAMDAMFSKRQKQLGILAQFYRGGHYHEPTIYGRGEIIVNGGLPGADGYSDGLGFTAESSQVISYYVDTGERPNSYYHSFIVCLEGI